MKPGDFLARNNIFTRDELAAVLQARGRAASTVDSHLARWSRQGRITRVKQGLFIRLNPDVNVSEPDPDFIVLASRMAPDAAVAYHTALAVHGYAHSNLKRFMFVTWSKTKPLSFQNRRLVSVRPRAPLFAADRGEHWIEWAERSGVQIRVTSLERTVVDVLDRPDLAGGEEEVWRSLHLVPALDLDLLEEYVLTLGCRTLAAKVGFFLESHKEGLDVSGALLDRLQTMTPRGPVYMNRRRKGRLVSRWGLVVPMELMREDMGEKHLMDEIEIHRLAKSGESETLEFKKSTAQLSRTGKTLCAFLNGRGGRVLVGVTPQGEVAGQQVSDKTQQEIAALLQRFEPPTPIEIYFNDLKENGKTVIVLEAPKVADSLPFTFNGRPYQRIGTTTSTMPQKRYESLLLERTHARKRWENQEAVDIGLEDLDHEEILRTREAAITQRRMSAGTGTDVGDILDRLGLRRDGVITQAAQVLYGTKYLPDYPQGMLKMGRFRGTTVIGDILDNKQEHLHAFAIVREGMAFLDRTLPLAARFPKGKIFREDRLPVPPDALREILLNAVMHRDYSDPSSYVAIAVFDDRIEIRSVGRLPNGVTLEMLSGPHRSIPRNPLIAEAFHRTGAVEIWGRGTNRVINACEKYGIDPPTFEELSGAVIVTFRASIGPDRVLGPGRDQVGTKSGPSRDQVGTKLALGRHQVQVLEVAGVPRSVQFLMQECGRKNRTKFRDQTLQPLLDSGLLAMTIPDKPTSSKQKYQTTAAGLELLKS